MTWISGFSFLDKPDGMQVGELKGTFGGLKLDVEAMFMQMPSVDLDQLGGQLEAMQHHQAQQVHTTLKTQSSFAQGRTCTVQAFHVCAHKAKHDR